MKVCITPRTRCVVEGFYKDIANCSERCFYRTERTMKEAKAVIKRHKDFISGYAKTHRITGQGQNKHSRGDNNIMYEYKIRQDENVTVSGYRKDHWWTVFEGTEELGFDETASFREREDADNFVKEKEKCQ